MDVVNLCIGVWISQHKMQQRQNAQNWLYCRFVVITSSSMRKCMNLKVFSVALLLICPANFAHAEKVKSQTNADTCIIQPSQLESLLALPTAKFDQDQSGGWRPYSQNGCYLQGAMLIDAYVADKPAKMTETDHRNLSFHAGQLYAKAGLKKIAVRRIMLSLSLHEDANSELDWNTYVLATIAFLQGDRRELTHQRAQLSAAKPTLGNKINLGVVDGLVSCFDKPYDEAYLKCRPTAK